MLNIGKIGIDISLESFPRVEKIMTFSGEHSSIITFIEGPPEGPGTAGDENDF